MNEAELELLRDSGGLSLDGEGQFFVHGGKVEHERSQRVLTQGMHRAPNGRWATRIGREWGYVEVRDVAFFIRRIEPLREHGAAANRGRLRCWLTSGAEEIVEAKDFSLGDNDALYVKIQNGELARLSRPAQLSLAEVLHEENGAAFLELGGARFPIAKKSAAAG